MKAKVRAVGSSVALVGLAISAALGYGIWLLTAPDSSRPNPWVGIGLTAVGLFLAGWAGTNDRDVDEQDRRDEWAVTSLLAVLAVVLFVLAEGRRPPALVVVLGAVIVGIGLRAAVVSRETSQQRAFRVAACEALKGPVPWRGLTIAGVLVASSGLIYDAADTESAREQVENICAAVDRPASAPRSCAALARDVVP